MKKQATSKSHSKKTSLPNTSTVKESTGSTNLLLLLLAALAILVTFLSYQPVKKNKLTNWDDDKYITNNEDIRKLDNEHLSLLLTKNYEGNYHPVTMLSYGWNYKTGKLNPQTYLYTNLFFHIANTALVFLFVWMLTGKSITSFIASLLFGIHPMHVESVAWASERKDVLYCFFFLLSVITYIQYLKKENYLYLLLALFAFALSLLSKAMAVPLAVVIVFIDVYYSRKFSLKLVAEKIPFLALAIAMGIKAIEAQQVGEVAKELAQGTVSETDKWSLMDRFVLASDNFVQYIVKLIAPVNLSIFYDYPASLTTMHWVSFGIIVLAALAILFLIVKKFPYNEPQKIYLFGILFFVANIFLVLQILPVGKAILADRYTYVSYIGLFIIAGYFIDSLASRYKNYQYLIYGAAGIYFAWFAIGTFQRSKVWKDSFTLWKETVKVSPSAVAYVNLGLSKEKDKGDIAAAYEDYKKAAQLDSTYSLAWNNMGTTKLNNREYKEAIAYLNKAIALNPNYLNSYGARGDAKFYSGDLEGAIKDYNTFLQRYQGHPDVYNMRGLARHHRKEYPAAIGDFTQAIEVGGKAGSNNMHFYYINRGLAYGLSGEFNKAEADYKKAIEYSPSYADAYYTLGNLQVYVAEQTNNPTKKEEGCNHLKKAAGLGHARGMEEAKKYCP